MQVLFSHSRIFLPKSRKITANLEGGFHMDEKKRTSKKRADIYSQFYDLKSVASEQGLTGLVPSSPQDSGELTAYEELEGTPVDNDDGD